MTELDQDKWAEQCAGNISKRQLMVLKKLRDEKDCDIIMCGGSRLVYCGEERISYKTLNVLMAMMAIKSTGKFGGPGDESEYFKINEVGLKILEALSE